MNNLLPSETFWKMIIEQSIAVVILFVAAKLLWKAFMADLSKKDQRYDALEKKFEELQSEFRDHIIEQQAEYMQVAVRSAEALERNNAILQQLAPLVKNFSR